MENAKNIVYGIWKSHENYLGKTAEGDPSFDLSKYFANLFCPGENFYYIIDSPTLTFDMVSPSIKSILGISPQDLTFENLIGNIHPDDIHFFMKCEDIVAYFLKNHVSPEKMVKYKITYCLREKTIDKGYRLFLLQTITMQTTTDGALLKVFGSHTDISHITNVNNYKLSFIGLEGEPSFLEIDVFDDLVLNRYKPFEINKLNTENMYSEREIEIIRYLSSGLTTGQIASKLYISKNTVETHRKNILNKSQVKNTTELVVDCIRKGII